MPLYKKKKVKPQNTGCSKIGVQTTYLLSLNVHEKNMEKMFPTKKSIIFIIKNVVTQSRLVYKSMRGMMTNSIDRDQWLNVTSESRDRI
jgi:hypothetical protein